MRLYLAFFFKSNLKTIYMGRGDIKTKRGKIFAGSFGKTRPAKTATTSGAAVAVAKEVAPKATKAKAVKAK
jgi:30S ribosomal protein S31